MGVVRDLLKDISIPEFYKVENHLDSEHIEDVEKGVRDALRRPGTLDRIEPGKTVCFTGSSREIANSVIILRTLAEEFKRVGAKPVLIPAMGSHGGATAEGQRDILARYGITEDAIGCPIVSQMKTEKIGVSKEGLDVHMDSFALSCDYIIPTGRIKPHTDFHGPFESGLMKMMAIGLGKQHGASICHRMGAELMPVNIPSFGRVALGIGKIPFCFGIVENGLHQTYKLAAIPAECVEEEEPELLKLAKSIMAKIPFEKLDVLIVEQIGKDISGGGMDFNVIGRDLFLHRFPPHIERIGVLSLSEKAGGNFNGIGMADITTRRVFDRMDFEETYPNNITANGTETAMIPIVMDTDKLCLQMCMRCCSKTGDDGLRIMWIKDTLHLFEFYVSKGLYKEALANPRLSVSPSGSSVMFNDKEEYIGFSDFVSV